MLWFYSWHFNLFDPKDAFFNKGLLLCIHYNLMLINQHADHTFFFLGYSRAGKETWIKEKYVEKKFVPLNSSLHETGKSDST